MPLFEYRCPNCQRRFEKLVRLADRTEEAICPHCGYERAERLISAFAIAGGSHTGRGLGSKEASSCTNFT